jgi:hypothetical protein
LFRRQVRSFQWAADGAVGPVLSDLAWNVYKGLQPHGTHIPLVFPLPGSSATVASSSATMMVVDRKS